MIIDTPFNIDLSSNHNKIPKMIYKQADTNSHRLVINILDKGLAKDLTNHTAKIYFAKPDGNEVYQSCVIDTPASGQMTCLLTSNTLAAVGTVNAEITIYGADGSINATITFPITVIAVLRNDASLQSTSEYSGLSDAMAQITNFSASLAAKASQVDVDTLNKINAPTKDRMLNLIKAYKLLYIIGDSISEGYKSDDFVNNSYAGLIIKAFNKEFNNKNYGFCSFRNVTDATRYHTVSKNGFALNTDPNSFDPAYFGGVRISSQTSGDSVTITYTGSNFKVAYGGRSDGGQLSVTVDGVNVGTLDTSVIGTYPNGSQWTAPTVSSWQQHTVVLTKLDTKMTDLCGMIYAEDFNNISIMNVARTTLQGAEIADNMLDCYSQSGMCILALGVNDNIYSSDVNTFTAKITRVCNNIQAKQGSLILCDFMFNDPDSNVYKTALRNISKQFPQFIFLDFAHLWFQNYEKNRDNWLLNSDTYHPTIDGHEFIANILLKYLGLPYTKQKLNQSHDFIMVNNFQNNWVNFGSYFQTAAYYKDDNGFVHLKGAIKGGTNTSGTVIFNLPEGYRPKTYSKLFLVPCNTTVGNLEIASNGNVQVASSTIDNTIVSLEGIGFDTD